MLRQWTLASYDEISRESIMGLASGPRGVLAPGASRPR